MKDADRFNLMADYYDRCRPGYPDGAVSAIVQYGGLSPDARILEVGAGSGKATSQFLARGLSLTCIEPGDELAARGQAQYGAQGARFIVSRFEDYAGEDAAWDAIISAQAFHWVSQPDGYRQCLRLLRPKGTLALMWNLDLFDDSEADHALWAVLDAHDGFVSCMRREDHPGRRERIAGEMARLFAEPEVCCFTQEIAYTPEEYDRYLHTSQVFIRQDEAQRARCLDALHALVHRYPEALRRRYTCEVYLARAPHQWR